MGNKVERKVCKININNFFRCACKVGYKKVLTTNGEFCTDINECEESLKRGTNPCGEATCVNQAGSYRLTKISNNKKEEKFYTD